MLWLASAMGSRKPKRSTADLRAVRADHRDTVTLVLGGAVEKVIRSKRAIVASKARLAAMRANRKANSLT